MSTLSATNIKNASSGSNNIVLGTSGQTTVNGDLLFNSGYGSAATAYGCRAWVNFNGTGTVAIRASGNVSSITDNGVGDYTVNFTTAMPDANYSIMLGNSRTNVSTANIAADIDPVTLPTASAMRFQTYNWANTAADASVVTVAIFR